MMQIKQQAGKCAICDILGVAHILGEYHLTKNDFLNEGANKVLELGSRVLKLWFCAERHENPVNTFNLAQPSVETLVDVAEMSCYRRLFAKPFSTFILVVTSLGRPHDYWREGVDSNLLEDEQKQFYELTKYLLTTYCGTDKTFVLQNWKGDWAVRGNTDSDARPTSIAIAGMINWLKARQAGVTQARCEVGQNGVRVYHAAEVNRVVDSMLNGKMSVVNSVLPHVNVDMASYSAYDFILSNLERDVSLCDVLDYIASHFPNSKISDRRNVYIGEFGIPESEYSLDQAKQVISNTVKVAMQWGCPYIVYWQLYCNELKYLLERKTLRNKDRLGGFWPIRPDGSKTWVWDYFSGLLRKDQNTDLERSSSDRARRIKSAEDSRANEKQKRVHEGV